MVNIIQGLKLLHRNGIAHRDIKPDNIMVDPTSLDIKYIDFGLACRMESCYSTMVGGTPFYMAPELFLDQVPDTLETWFKVDYWALGATLMEIILHKTFLEEYLNRKITNIMSLTYFMKGLNISDDQLTALLGKHQVTMKIFDFAESYIFPLLKKDPVERHLVYYVPKLRTKRISKGLIDLRKQPK